jgi:cyclohexa-1,5-dienecarbonyl-CoA hydratase
MSVRLEPFTGEERASEVVVDRPPLNVLDLATLGELERVLAQVAAAPPQVLVVRGGGERAFSAGVAVEDHTPDRIETMLGRFHGALALLRDLPSITVAAVRGHCLGGGMELAAACDLVVAAADARFGQPEIRLGCFPPFAAAAYPALLGAKRAADLLLTGRALSAGEAHGLGFVARVAPAAGLDSAVSDLADELLAHSGAVLALTRRALRAGEDEAALERALAECERLYFEELVETRDMEEGVTAFLERRPPSWRHR